MPNVYQRIFEKSKDKQKLRNIYRTLQQLPAVDGESIRFIMAIIASEIQNKEGTIIFPYQCIQKTHIQQKMLYIFYTVDNIHNIFPSCQILFPKNGFAYICFPPKKDIAKKHTAYHHNQ